MRPVFDPSAVHHLKHRGAVDADGHVLEDAGLWEHYIEARYRDRALRMKRDDEGAGVSRDRRPAEQAHAQAAIPPRLGRMGQKDLEAFKPHPDKTYAANMPYGACNADERLKLLDAEGLEAAVLYPTLGILWEAELTDVELSQAYCRAYNRWIADFCRTSKGRLIPIAHLSLGDPAAAALELERAVKDGCRGAFVVPFASTHKAHGDPAHDRDLRQGRRTRRADRHPSRLRALRIALAALRERPSPVAARRGDGRRRRAPGLHHLLRLRDLRPLPQAEAGAAGIAARAGSATGSTGWTAWRPPPSSAAARRSR